MRRLLRQTMFIVLFGTIFILSGCYFGGGRSFDTLCQADSLMQQYPDSALSLLKAISDPKELPPAQYAHYALLLTQAYDKNYITHTDDSLICSAVNYYDSKDDVDRQAKAHYYWGRVHQDRGMISSCVREYLAAISLAEKAKEDDISYLAYANLGHVFYQEDLNDRADSCFQQAELLAIQCRDSIRWAWILANRGENYLAKEEESYDIAKGHLNHALSIAEIIGSKSIERLASASLSTLYSKLDNGKMAVHFARRCIALNKTKGYYGAFLLLGDGYFKLGQYDSAKVYLMKSLPADNYDTKIGIYMRLSDIAKIEGRYEEAVDFENRVTAYQDSARLYKQDVAVISAVKDVQIRAIKQNQTHSFSRFSYLFFSLGTVLVLLVVLFIYKRRKYRQEVLNVHVDREKLKAQLVFELEQKSIELEQLQQSLRLKVLDSAGLRDQIRILEEDKRQILSSLLKYAEIYQKIRDIISYYKEYSSYKDHFEEHDWTHLMASIDPLAKFRERLMSCNDSLLEDEIRLCYLFKMKLSIIDISIVMGCQRDNIYKKKKAVTTKLDPFAGTKELKVLLDEIYPAL